MSCNFGAPGRSKLLAIAAEIDVVQVLNESWIFVICDTLECRGKINDICWIVNDGANDVCWNEMSKILKCESFGDVGNE